MVLGRTSSRARALTFDDVGDPNGTPVVYLHGGGDSRLTRHPDDSIAAELGVRLLAVERSGPPERGRTLRRWAERVVGGVPVERFAVVGWSAGGPHALAVAAVAQDRVTRVALVASMPPPDQAHHLADDVRQVTRVAGYSLRWAAFHLERWGRRPVLETGDPRTDEAYARGRLEAFRHGGLTLARELRYIGRPWDFDLSEVRVPVTLWAGDEDTVCPPAISEALAARLPNATLKVVEGTHQLLFPRWREILADVTSERVPPQRQDTPRTDGV